MKHHAKLTTRRIGLLLPLFLGACAKDIAAVNPAPLSFAHEAAFVLPGSNVVVQDEALPQRPLPSVEHPDQETAADIVRAFARDRLRVKPGETRPVVVRILDASVVEEGLPTQYGYVGYLAGEQNRQFTGHIKVELDFYENPRQKGPTRITAEASASRPLPASSGPNGSSQEYYNLIDVLARDLDGALATQLAGFQAGL